MENKQTTPNIPLTNINKPQPQVITKIPTDIDKLTPVQIEQMTSSETELKKFLLNFEPKRVPFYEFNPLHKMEFSLPSMAISFSLLAYYRRRYFLINNFTLAFFSLGVNYFCSYYLLENSLKFYEYYNNYKNIN